MPSSMPRPLGAERVGFGPGRVRFDQPRWTRPWSGSEFSRGTPYACRGVVPGGHALLVLVPARRDIGMRSGKNDHHLVVEELFPLRVVLRHMHVDDDLLALLVDGHRQVRGVQHPARAGHEDRKIVRTQEREQVASAFQAVIGRGIHFSSFFLRKQRERKTIYSLSAIAWAAMLRRADVAPIIRRVALTLLRWLLPRSGRCCRSIRARAGQLGPRR